jgi:hypothetical protein
VTAKAFDRFGGEVVDISCVYGLSIDSSHRLEGALRERLSDVCDHSSFVNPQRVTTDVLKGMQADVVKSLDFAELAIVITGPSKLQGTVGIVLRHIDAGARRALAGFACDIGTHPESG